MSVIQIETAREIIISKVTEFNQEYISYHNFTIFKIHIENKSLENKRYVLFGLWNHTLKNLTHT